MVRVSRFAVDAIAQRSAAPRLGGCLRGLTTVAVEVDGCGCGACVDPEFAEEVREMHAHGFGRDDEPPGDFAIGESGADEIEEFGFAAG